MTPDPTPTPGGPVTPPQLPAPSTNPTAPPPTSGAGQPTLPTPGTPPQVPGTVARQPQSGRTTAAGSRGRRATLDVLDDWVTWWRLNRRALLPARGFGDAAGVTGRGVDPAGAADARRAQQVAAEALPALLALTDPATKTSVHLRHAALLALPKVANDAKVQQRLLHWLRDAKAPAPLRGAAALGIGLLRRTERSAQMDAIVLDGLRSALMAAFDDADMPPAVRTLAPMGVALLGDQPFGEGLFQDGRALSHGLWKRLGHDWRHADYATSLLVALAHQPSAGVPQGVRDGLGAIVLKGRARGRAWDDTERSHAFSALAQLGRPSEVADQIQRTLGMRHAPRGVHQAAWIAVAKRAHGWNGATRLAVAKVLDASASHAKDPLSKGLLSLARAHLLRADLRAGSDALAESSRIPHQLWQAAASGGLAERGFGALALGLSLHEAAPAGRHGQAWRLRVHRHCTDVLTRGRGEAHTLGAFAIGSALSGNASSTAALRALLVDRDRQPVLRGHAAVALAQLGNLAPETRKALFAAVAGHMDSTLTQEAGLALGILDGALASRRLTALLAQEDASYERARTILALGRVGDPAAMPALAQVATDPAQVDARRVLAVIALGLAGDPEDAPSLRRFARHANYPARTQALHRVWTAR